MSMLKHSGSHYWFNSAFIRKLLVFQILVNFFYSFSLPSLCHSLDSEKTNLYSAKSSNIGGAFSARVLPFVNDIHITLDGGKMVTYPNHEGEFEFHRVLPGIHIVSAFHPELQFPSFMVNVTKNELYDENNVKKENFDSKPSAFIYDPLMGMTKEVPMPFTINYSRKLELVFQKPYLPILALVKNPMVIFGIIFLILIQFLPYLQKLSEQAQGAQEQMSNREAKEESTFISNL